MTHLGRLASMICLAAALHAPSASAQTYPNRPITLISVYGPGSPQDLVTRALAEIVAKDLGQSIVVDNKPGSGVGQSLVFAAKPDGYTIATGTSGLILVPLMLTVVYDPFKDFTYIMQAASFPIGIAVKADSPFKSWSDVVAHAKANPGSVTFGTPGAGGIARLGMERIQSQSAIKLTHVPFQGPMTIIPAVLGGHIMLQVTGTEWKPQVDAGQMRLLMTWGAVRNPSYPNVPTLRELGYPFDMDVSFGLIGPKGMDPAVATVLHNAFKKALETPAIGALIAKYDMIPHYATGGDFRTTMLELSTAMKPIVDQLGIGRKK